MRGGSTRAERLITLLGYLFSILPAMVAVMTYFPLLHDRGESEHAVSLGAVLLIALSLLPLRRAIRQFLRSPSAWKVWLVLFFVFYLTESIATEMLAVSTVGLLGSLVGLVFFRLAALMRTRRENHGGA